MSEESTEILSPHLGKVRKSGSTAPYFKGVYDTIEVTIATPWLLKKNTLYRQPFNYQHVMYDHWIPISAAYMHSSKPD